MGVEFIKRFQVDDRNHRVASGVKKKPQAAVNHVRWVNGARGSSIGDFREGQHTGLVGFAFFRWPP